MRTTLYVILLLCASVSVHAQQTTGKLNPGESFVNQSESVVFYMPKSKVVTFLNYQTKAEFDSMRVEKYKELVANMEMRVMEADSAISLRNYEAQYWKMQLESNDRQLEQVRIQKETLQYENDKIRRSRIYYLLGGMVATSILYIGLN